MKKIILSLITIGLAGLLVSAVAQDAPGDNNLPPPPSDATDLPMPPPDLGGQPQADTVMTTTTNTGPAVILPATGKTAPAETVEVSFMPPATGTNADELRLNFRNAPLEMVLNYLSDAAGFIIVLDTKV